MKLLDKNSLKNNIEKIAHYDFCNQKVFGCSYAVIQNDETVYKNHFGFTSNNGITKVSDDTLFRLASMTKPITAFATLILADNGQISLSDKVSKYLPEFENIHIIDSFDKNNYIDLGKPKKHPTIRDLLTHTSGIGSNTYKLQKMTAEDKSSLDNTVTFLADIGLDFEPSRKQAYSGFGAYDVLVKIIENVTETNYEIFLKNKIFEPCGMVNTTFIPTPNQWKNLIAMHNKCNGKSVNANMKSNCIFEDFPCTHFVGGAGLISSLTDYLNFTKMLLNSGSTHNESLISKETFNLLHTPSVSTLIMPGNQNWGLGVRVITDKSYCTLPVGTFGWSGAYGSHFWIDPQNKIAAVYMKNSLFDGGAANESARNFEKAVNDSLI